MLSSLFIKELSNDFRIDRILSKTINLVLRGIFQAAKLTHEEEKSNFNQTYFFTTEITLSNFQNDF